MREFKATGIVLCAKPFFEKDKLIDLFSEDHGKIKVLVKGAASHNSKIGARVEPLNEVTCQLFRGKSFVGTRTCDLVKSQLAIRDDWNKLILAFYCIDIIKKSTAYDQETPELYKLLKKSLTEIAQESTYQITKQKFQKRYLEIEGLLESHLQEVNEQKFTQAFENYTGHKVLEHRV